jgi:hypothetical protein
MIGNGGGWSMACSRAECWGRRSGDACDARRRMTGWAIGIGPRSKAISHLCERDARSGTGRPQPTIAELDARRSPGQLELAEYRGNPSAHMHRVAPVACFARRCCAGGESLRVWAGATTERGVTAGAHPGDQFLDLRRWWDVAL